MDQADWVDEIVNLVLSLGSFQLVADAPFAKDGAYPAFVVEQVEDAVLDTSEELEVEDTQRTTVCYVLVSLHGKTTSQARNEASDLARSVINKVKSEASLPTRLARKRMMLGSSGPRDVTMVQLEFVSRLEEVY